MGSVTKQRPEVRSLVVALAAVANSTKACALRGDAATFAQLEEYYALVADAVGSVGGEVVKFMGDAALIVFPADHVREAVAALRNLQTRGTALWKAFHPECGLQVKVGAGEFACGMLGAPGAERFDIVGDALNRLFKAPWGEFELTAEVAALLG